MDFFAWTMDNQQDMVFSEFHALFNFTGNWKLQNFTTKCNFAHFRSLHYAIFTLNLRYSGSYFSISISVPLYELFNSWCTHTFNNLIWTSNRPEYIFRQGHNHVPEKCWKLEARKRNFQQMRKQWANNVWCALSCPWSSGIRGARTP